MKKFLVIAAIIAMATGITAQRYVGGDISMLPTMEEAGSQYKTHDGKPIPDLLPFLREQGMNAMRVRLFVNPDDYQEADKDPNACQDLDYITPLCKRIKDEGFDLMLDFHYSDTWADPAQQWTPKAWGDLTDEELYVKIYEYTKESLEHLVAAGATPDFIQPGNEISYGMLWGPAGTPTSQLKKINSSSTNNWSRFGKLLQNAIKACREVCPDAKIIIHTERVSNISTQRHFYDQMRAMKIDYDIIGVSYYPYFHGNMSVLDNALSALEARYTNKNIMVVETGFPLKWEVPGTNQKVDYDYSDAGQNQFAQELVETLLKHPKVDGLFWWWLEYNAKGTSLSNWYNAPLFDSETGKATSALKTICSFASDSGVDGIERDDLYDNERETDWYNLQGLPVFNPDRPGIYIHNGKKVMVK